MKISLDGAFEFEFFEIEELKNAEQYAEKVDELMVYSWKATIGYSILSLKKTIVCYRCLLGLAISAN